MSNPLRRQVQDLLLGYLAHVDWPGAEGMTIDDALLCYVPAASQGLVPRLPELVSGYPHLASELRTFFGTPDAWVREGK
jgi:hypothetical protein